MLKSTYIVNDLNIHKNSVNQSVGCFFAFDEMEKTDMNFIYD